MGSGLGNFTASGIKQRETTFALGRRQALNAGKTRNLLLMIGRSFQTASSTTGQSNWIAYVGVQYLFGLKSDVPAVSLPEAPRLSSGTTIR